MANENLYHRELKIHINEDVDGSINIEIEEENSRDGSRRMTTIEDDYEYWNIMKIVRNFDKSFWDKEEA